MVAHAVLSAIVLSAGLAFTAVVLIVAILQWKAKPLRLLPFGIILCVLGFLGMHQYRVELAKLQPTVTSVQVTPVNGNVNCVITLSNGQVLNNEPSAVCEIVHQGYGYKHGTFTNH